MQSLKMLFYLNTIQMSTGRRLKNSICFFSFCLLSAFVFYHKPCQAEGMIAIFDCVDGTGGQYKSYAESVGGTFVDVFARSEQLILLERSQLIKAMEEREGHKKGKFVIREKEALELGESLGAGNIIVSKLTKTRKKIILTARIIDVGTKEIKKSKKGKAPLEEYDYLAEKVAGKLLQGFTGENVLEPEELDNIAQMDNREDKKKQDKAKAQKVISDIFGNMMNLIQTQEGAEE